MTMGAGTVIKSVEPTGGELQYLKWGAWGRALVGGLGDEVIRKAKALGKLYLFVAVPV